MSEGWTVDTLKKHFEALRSADLDAVAKTSAAMEKRLDGMNEFRKTIDDRDRTFMPRSEAEKEFKALADRMDRLAETLSANAAEKRGQGNVWGWVIGAIGLLATLASIAAFVLSRK